MEARVLNLLSVTVALSLILTLVPGAPTSAAPSEPPNSPGNAGPARLIFDRIGGPMTPGSAATGLMPPASPGEAHEQRAREAYAQLPVYFIENQGQRDECVAYYVQQGGADIYFTAEEVVMALPETVLRTRFVGANPDVRITGDHQQKATFNHFIGNDPDQWHTDIRSYAEVTYHELYPGVDLSYSGRNGVLKYEFVLQPGADVEAIRLAYAGADELRLADDDHLLITPEGASEDASMRDAAPAVYQEVDGTKQVIAGGYVLHGKQQVGFQVAEYDPTRPLVIDPELAYATFLGGDYEDGASDIAVDASGNVYVTGNTYSSDFPTQNPARQPGGRRDAFVTKLSPDGQSLVYSTYLGGDKAEYGTGIALDETGKVYVTGYTSSSDFPTVNPTQGSFGGFIDGFVVSLNASGSALSFSSYIGGSGAEYGEGVAVCDQGTVCVTGYTGSTDLPTVSPEQPSYGGGWHDGFVSKIDVNGPSVLYATYLGGEFDDRGYGVACDGAGNAYVVGYTVSSDFPTTVGAFLTSMAGSMDGFVTKFNATGSAHEYSTYLGGNDDIFGNDEEACGVAVDSTGHAYVVGDTQSEYFPTTPGAYDTSPNYSGDGWEVEDAFVSKLKADGSDLVFSTVLGGTGPDWGTAIAVDKYGSAYVAGDTQSSDFPTKRAFQGTHGGGTNDAFVAQLNSDGSDLIYASYLGGSADDWMGWAGGIAVDGERNTYVAGYTGSTDFPTVNPFQASHGDSGSYWDGFVVKVGTAPESVSAVITPAEGGSLSSASGETTLVFPGGAFTETARLTYTPRQTAEDTNALADAGYSFELTAVYSDTGETAQLTPGATYTTVITYTTTGPAIEHTLALYYWDGAQWVKEPTSVLDMADSTVTATPDHFSLWAVLGETRRVFLPVILSHHWGFYDATLRQDTMAGQARRACPTLRAKEIENETSLVRPAFSTDNPIPVGVTVAERDATGGWPGPTRRARESHLNRRGLHP